MIVMKQCTEDDEDTPLCPKEFRNDLQQILVRHVGGSWEFKWSTEENGFSMRLWAWKEEKEDETE